MVDVDFLCVAVANGYRYQPKKSKKQVISRDYENCVSVAEALYGHDRLRMPYKLVLIGRLGAIDPQERLVA
jgi:hypothetical protein